MRSFVFLMGILLCLNGTTVHSQQDTFSLKALFNQPLDAAKLVLEVDLLKSWIGRKKYNRTGFLFCSRDSFNTQVELLRKELLQRETIAYRDYANHLAKLVRYVKDDHAYFSLLTLPGEKEQSTEKIIPPLHMVVYNHRCYVTHSAGIAPRSEVLKIGEFPAIEVAEKVLKFYNYNEWAYLNSTGFAELNFVNLSPILYYHFGFEDQINITYREKGGDEPKKKVLPLYAFRDPSVMSAFEPDLKAPTSNFELRFIDDVAIIELKTFRRIKKGMRSFTDFYNDSFKKIKQAGSKKLLIDISHNGGGSDMAWLVLLNFIHDGQVKYYHDKPTMELKDLTKIALRSKKKNALKVFDLDQRFSGEIFLLTGPKTYSAATNMADFIKFNKIATLMGVETPGWKTHYGQVKRHTLPHSGIKLALSSKLLYGLEGKAETGGVVPDQHITFENIDQFWNYYLDHRWADELAKDL